MLDRPAGQNLPAATRAVSPAEFRKMTRRQLLALAPALSLGALASPAARN